MNERLGDVWESRDYPVLCEVARQIDTGAIAPEIFSIAEAVNMDTETVAASAEALRRAGYVTLLMGAAGPWAFEDITGATYTVTGLHPDADDALSRLVELLRQAADQTGDEEEKTRLKRAADALLGASGKVMTGVMTAYVTGLLPH